MCHSKSERKESGSGGGDSLDTIFLPILAGEGMWQGQYVPCGEASCYFPLLQSVLPRGGVQPLVKGNTGGIYPLSCGRMNGEAEAWLEGAYPQLYGQWRQAYLKPAARQQDQAGDLCRICYIRQVTQLAVGTITSNLAAFRANNLSKHGKIGEN